MRLWLNLGSFFVQPLELLRLLMIAFLAAYFAERATRGRELPPEAQPASPCNRRSLAPTLAMGFIALAMLAIQQDLGAASLLVVTFAFMLYLATGDARLPLGLAVELGVAAMAGYFLSARGAAACAPATATGCCWPAALLRRWPRRYLSSSAATSGCCRLPA